MLWKIIFLSFALCVLGEDYGSSEHRFKISHKGKSDQSKLTQIGSKEDSHYGSLSHIGPKKPEHHEEYAWAYPSYVFSYDVYDPHTHDIKGQKESRDGDKVTGEYWLIQPDGLKRTVKYHADKHSGFYADVHYSDTKYKYEDKKEEETASEEREEEESYKRPEDVYYSKKSKETETDGKYWAKKGKEAESKSKYQASYENEEENKNEYASEEEQDEDSSEEEEGEGRDTEKSHGKEELGKWIHNRYWGYHSDKNRQKNNYDLRDNDSYSYEYPSQRKYKAEYKNSYSFPIISKLGNYGNRQEYDEEESNSRPAHRKPYEPRTYSEQKNRAIVRENYAHPSLYKRSRQ